MLITDRILQSLANYFTLDVISDLTFGRAYGLIINPDLRWVIEAIVAGNRHIYMRFACPWLFNLPWGNPSRWLFPNMSDERQQFTNISNKFTEERIALIEEGKFDRQDIMTALLAARDPKTGERLSDAETWSEAHLMIAAGTYRIIIHRIKC
jgi:cytochrome P450